MKNLILAATFLIASTAVVAQPQGRQGAKAQKVKERVETAHIAFLTKQLELTPEEAQVFWPIYNQYQAEMKAVRAKYRQKSGALELESIDNMTDKEAIKAMQDHKALMDETHAIKAKYHTKFLEVLSPKKVLKLYAAEREFKQRVLRRMRQGQHGQGGRGGRARGGHGAQHGEMGGYPGFMH